MTNKEIKFGDKTYSIHPMLAIDFDRLQSIDDNVEKMRVLHTTCSNMSVEEYNLLSLVDRNQMTVIINKMNGWTKLVDDDEIIEDIDKKKE